MEERQMKRRAIAVVCAVLISSAATAETRMAIRTTAPDMERLSILLDLDAYQVNEVERILTQPRQRRVGTLEEMQDYRRQIEQETREQLRMVLTEEQLTKYELLMQEQQPRMLMRGALPPTEH
jgi:excinuclease UvrABC helicase subunit UvrB